MCEKLEDDIEVLPYEKFEKIFNDMREKPGKKYIFLTEGGVSLKMALYHLFKEAWKSMNLPKNGMSPL